MRETSILVGWDMVMSMIRQYIWLKVWSMTFEHSNWLPILCLMMIEPVKRRQRYVKTKQRRRGSHHLTPIEYSSSPRSTRTKRYCDC